VAVRSVRTTLGGAPIVEVELLPVSMAPPPFAILGGQGLRKFGLLGPSHPVRSRQIGVWHPSAGKGNLRLVGTGASQNEQIRSDRTIKTDQASVVLTGAQRAFSER
jgi:hypothetical protein